jgi:hypothetical protein
MNTRFVQKPSLILITVLLIATIIASLFFAGAIGSLAFQSVTIPVKVEDPIEILNYPIGLSFYPGQTKEFSLTIKNAADVIYTITLDFQLNDTNYQSRYVTFEKNVFTIAPGEQTLNTSLKISPNAPPATLFLTISRRSDTNPPTTAIPTQPPQTPQPTIQTLSPTDSTSNMTLLPSLVLFQGGAKWASPNGTKALYLSWLDNYAAHGLTDGQDWGPWFDIPTMDTWKAEIVETLQQDGFTVTSVGDLPQNLSGYDLVVLEAFWAIEPRHQTLIKSFISNGGGVVMLGGTPCYFSVYCKDRWPYRAGEWPTGPGGTDLTSLSDWFGYKNYLNVGGSAYPSINNPFDTSLLSSDELFYTAGGSAASVCNPVGDTTVIAKYKSETNSTTQLFPFVAPFTNSPFAFIHTYGAGRLYWQGHIWPY